jgi:thioredoxin reductase (NADPH)
VLCAAGAVGVLKKEKSALPSRKIPVRQRVCAWDDPLTANRSRTVRKTDALRPGHGNFSKKGVYCRKMHPKEGFPMPSIIIIGSGPAGISAALYAVRAGVDTTVLTKGPGALDRAEKIENYYGFAEPVSGAELERRSIENAKRLGVRFVTAEAVGLTYTDKLTVETVDKNYPADAVILATGASRAVPRIPGLAGLEGHGVSYCAACDAFFYRGKDVAVLGSGEYALHEVQALLPVAKSVALLTNGAPLTADFPPEVTVHPQAVEAVLGETVVTGVQLSGGVQLPVSGVFVALGVAGSTALARKIGAEVDGNRIVVDEKMQTTVPGLYAAGDCTGGLLQMAKAVYEGAQAGTEAAKALRKG